MRKDNILQSESSPDIGIVVAVQTLSDEDIEKAGKNGWRILNISPNNQSGMHVAICSQNHYCVIRDFSRPCDICNVLNKTGRYLQVINSAYSQGQETFEFVCNHDHHMMVGPSTELTGCPMCEMEKNFFENGRTIKFDHMLFTSEHTRMRFYCTYCASEHYITYNKWKTLFGPNKKPKGCRETVIWWCKQGHQTSDRKILSITYASDILEQLFDCRFDDHVQCGVQFTGYNAKLKIAYNHTLDPVYSRNSSAEEWCRANGVILLTIRVRDPTYESVLTEICRELTRLNVHTRYSEVIVRKNEACENYYAAQLLAYMLLEGRKVRRKRMKPAIKLSSDGSKLSRKSRVHAEQSGKK